jgi:hypothetical protein
MISERVYYGAWCLDYWAKAVDRGDLSLDELLEEF